MSRYIAIFFCFSTLLLAKQNLKFKVNEKNSKMIEISIGVENKNFHKIEKDSSQNKKVVKLGEYKVVKGDTMYRISLKTKNSIETLTKLNNIIDPKVIEIGQILKYYKE